MPGEHRVLLLVVNVCQGVRLHNKTSRDASLKEAGLLGILDGHIMSVCSWAMFIIRPDVALQSEPMNSCSLTRPFGRPTS